MRRECGTSSSAAAAPACRARSDSPSSLPVALYSKFEIFQENLAKAEAARQEKEDRARVLAANQAEQMERVRGLREKARERNGVAVEEDRQEKLNQGAGAEGA